jgi:glutamate racemase
MGKQRNGGIGVFDSGIGGLTVLRALIDRLPQEHFLYLGDTARVPYGNKSPETVTRFAAENVAFLVERGVKLVVVACNTASAVALSALVERFRLPILGVIEPGVRAAVRSTRTGRIGVIGTAATVRSGRYERGILDRMPRARVSSRACPLFVPLVEEGWIDTPVTEMVAHHYLDPLRHEGIDTLVLGCTHYPLLKPVIARVLGREVRLVDSAVETAEEVARVLEERELGGEGGGGRFRVFLSDASDCFQEVGERILGKPIERIELIER